MMRKYMEIEYGEMAPEIFIPEPMPMGIINEITRNINNTLAISEITMNMRKCNIFQKLMGIHVTNTSFHREGYNVPLRIYHPEGEGKFPVMVFFHGGGFMLNNIDVYDCVHRYFAAFGNVLVFTIDYRLAPEYKFPTGLEDCYAGVEWAVQNASYFNGNVSSLTVCGDSAGGNFAAAISLMARDRKGPKIHKQMLIYPVVTFGNEPTRSEERYGKGYFLEKSDISFLLKSYFHNMEQAATNPYASPLLAENLMNLPPAVFISAECDILIDQALMYAARLEDEGIPVEYHIYKGMIHGFINQAYGKTFDALNDICKSIPQL